MDAGEKLPASLLALPLALAGEEPATLGGIAGWTVLYFYPKDNTPGCTRQGLEFQALLPEFRRLDAQILGVSRDSVKSHAGFRTRQGFDFDLVSDAEERLCRAFGVIQTKKNYGREYEGIVRSTFLIDPARRIVRKWQPVKVPGHAQAVLDALREAASQ